MKIKIIKGVCCAPWYLSALIGDTIDVSDEIGKQLIAAERAVKNGVKEITQQIEEEIAEETPKKKGK